MARTGVSLILAALIFAWPAAASAAFSDCDPLLTEQEKESRKWMETFPPLAAIFAAYDSCSAGRSFLNRMSQKSSNGRSSFSNEQIESSLEEEGLPASGVSSCLWTFSATACREFLNRRRTLSTERPAKEIADEYAGMLGAGSSPAQKFAPVIDLAQRGLDLCENALKRSERYLDPLAERNCQLAEENVALCLSSITSFKANQSKLQALIDTGKLGDTAPQYMAYAHARAHSCPLTLRLTSKEPRASLTEVTARLARAEKSAESRESSSMSRAGTPPPSDRSAEDSAASVDGEIKAESSVLVRGRNSATAQFQDASTRVENAAVRLAETQRIRAEGDVNELLELAERQSASGLTGDARATRLALARRFPDSPSAASIRQDLAEEARNRAQLDQAQREADFSKQRAAASLAEREAQAAERRRQELDQALQTVQQTLQSVAQRRNQARPAGGTAGGSGQCPPGKNFVNGSCVAGVAQ